MIYPIIMIVAFITFTVIVMTLSSFSERTPLKDKVSSVVGIITGMTAILSVAFAGYQVKIQNDASNSVKTVNTVSTWVKSQGANADVVHISDQSGQPIYDVVVSFDEVEDNSLKIGTYDKDKNCQYIQCLPMGEYKITVPHGKRYENTLYNASITFTDSNGKSWERCANGRTNSTCDSLTSRKMPDELKSVDYEADPIKQYGCIGDNKITVIQFWGTNDGKTTLISLYFI